MSSIETQPICGEWTLRFGAENNRNTCIREPGHEPPHRAENGEEWGDAPTSTNEEGREVRHAFHFETLYAGDLYANVVYGRRTSYPNRVTYDSERSIVAEARAFHITTRQYAELEEGPLEYVTFYIEAPFDVFMITTDDNTFEPVITDNKSVETRSEYLLVDARSDPWVLYERVLFRDTSFMKPDDPPAAVITVTAFSPKTGQVIAIDPENVKPDTEADRQNVAREHVRGVMVVVSFLSLLQHRRIHTQTIEMNRQQRRALEREGRPSHNLLVRLSPTITIRGAIDEAFRGENVRHPKAHEVMKHRRTYRSGKEVWVRAHARGGTPEERANYNAKLLFKK